MYDLPQPPPVPHLPSRFPPSLRSTCEGLLRLHWSAVHDVGDSPYDLIASLLRLSSGPQLALIESNSPHLSPSTNHLWKELCVNDFVEVRKLIEDGRMQREDEPSSWRERYGEEEKAREARMQAVLSKMRGQYSDHKAGRGTVKSIDGASQEKRRKTGQVASARPKTLFEKARTHTKAITSIYAPKRRPIQYSAPSKVSRIARPPPRPASTHATPPSCTSSSSALTSAEQRKPAVTVVRHLKRPVDSSTPISPRPTKIGSPHPRPSPRPVSRPPPSSTHTAQLPSALLPNPRTTSRPLSFSPPPLPHSVRLATTLTSVSATSPPPPPAGSSRPPPRSSLFMPAKRRQ